MAHTHPILDTDVRFVIDPVTRSLTNMSKKTVLMQYDHNSERFTFEIPRFVEGHDMQTCNRVEIHYINIKGSSKEKNPGVYEVRDMQSIVTEDNNELVTFTWLVSENATAYAGTLSFLVLFACVEDGDSVYRWSTNINSSIIISAGMENGGAIEEALLPDILAQWKHDLFEKNFAYEVALEHGFVGTEKEWHDSMKGDKGDAGLYVGSDEPNALSYLWFDNSKYDNETDGIFRAKDTDGTKYVLYPETRVDMIPGLDDTINIFNRQIDELYENTREHGQSIELTKTDVSELQTNVNSISTDVSELQTNVNSISTDVSELQTAVTGLGPDSTLSIRGQAADAKAVGDAVRESRIYNLNADSGEMGEWTSVHTYDDLYDDAEELLCFVEDYDNGVFINLISHHNSNKWFLTKKMSHDGVNWSVADQDISDLIYPMTCYDMIYGNGYFVVASGLYMHVSRDLETWDVLDTKNLIDTRFYSIAYGNGRFVVVGNNKISYSEGSHPTSWKPVEYDFGEFTFNSVFFANGLFVAIGTGYYVYTSIDGVTWTRSTISNDKVVTLNSITYGNGQFVAVGYDYISVWSSDGYNWESNICAGDRCYSHIFDIANGYSSQGYLNVTYGNGIFVATSNDMYATICYSYDGTTWQTALSNITKEDSDYAAIAIIYGNGAFITNYLYGILCSKTMQKELPLESAVNELNLKSFMNRHANIIKIGVATGKTTTAGILEMNDLYDSDAMILSAYRLDTTGIVIPFVNNTTSRWHFRVETATTSIALAKSVNVQIVYAYICI